MPQAGRIPRQFECQFYFVVKCSLLPFCGFFFVNLEQSAIYFRYLVLDEKNYSCLVGWKQCCDLQRQNIS